MTLRMGRETINKFVKKGFPYFLVLPAVLGVSVLGLYPFALGLWLSFHEKYIASPNITFVGLQNYIRTLQDPDFLHAIYVSVVWTFTSQVSSFFIGFGIALLLNREFKGRIWFRSLLIIPWAIPQVAACMVWLWMFDPTFGIIPATLIRLGVTSRPITWLSDPNYALPTVTGIMIWKSFPFFMIMMLAALQGVPDRLYEAAVIDGASIWQKFLNISVPLTAPLAVVALLVNSVNAFKNFEVIWLLTGGGPVKATRTLIINIYLTTFRVGRFGFGAAQAFTMFFVIMVLTLFYIRSYIRMTKVGIE